MTSSQGFEAPNKIPRIIAGLTKLDNAPREHTPMGDRAHDNTVAARSIEISSIPPLSRSILEQPRRTLQTKTRADQSAISQLRKRTIRGLHALPPLGNALMVPQGHAETLMFGRRSSSIGIWGIERTPVVVIRFPQGVVVGDVGFFGLEPIRAAKRLARGFVDAGARRRDITVYLMGNMEERFHWIRDSMIRAFGSRARWPNVRQVHLGPAPHGANEDESVLLVTGRRNGRFRIYHHGQLLVND